MSLLEDNFAITAKLDTHAAVKIQSMVRMLENYDTKITLSNPAVGGNTVDFIMADGGFIEDLDTCCRIKDVNRNNNTLEA